LEALVAIMESLHELNQYERLWIDYRDKAESLKHEKYLFLAGAGLYAQSSNPTALLAERVEGFISPEHAKWAKLQEQRSEAKATPKTDWPSD
jgi:hypothetical protein